MLCSCSWLLFAQAPTDSTKLEPVHTTVTVNENIATEAPAFVTVLDRTDIAQQPGVNLDDRLRAVPGFTLFRRSSSLVANPTTQGVSLRGLGSSGASRTLVLWDGIPLNDPFGGWVYWTRVDPNDLARVEVLRGAATSVFGDRAMSGSIGLFTRPAEPTRLSGSIEFGNERTRLLSGGFSHVWDKFAMSARARGFETDGYYVVQEHRRGPADAQAGVRFATGDVRLDFLGNDQRLYVKFDALAEERANGTVLTENSTSLGTLSANYSRQWTSDTFSAVAYHTREQYHATFSAVMPDRRTERITFFQTVPSHGTGGALMWRHQGGGWSLVGGTDAQRVKGTSTDVLQPTGLRQGGGAQTQQGTFANFDLGRGPLHVYLGGRQQFTGGSNNFFSPSAGLSFGGEHSRFRGSVFRAFRAPTLNELYRDFRAGNAETRANANLLPEKLFGAEVGWDLNYSRWRLQLTAFRNELTDLITNVTVSTTPQLISRQRRNAAEGLTRGFDATLEGWTGPWRGEISYLFSESRFVTGERLPQVPKHSGSALLSYVRDGTLVSGGLRTFSSQFEDDRNTFLMGGFATVQFALKQRIREGLSAICSIDNAANREYAVGITAPAGPGLAPLIAIGSPRLWRVGLQWDR